MVEGAQADSVRIAEQLGERDGFEPFDERRALASVGDFEVVFVDEGEKFVAGEQVEDLTGVRHARGADDTRMWAGLGRG